MRIDRVDSQLPGSEQMRRRKFLLHQRDSQLAHLNREIERDLSRIAWLEGKPYSRGVIAALQKDVIVKRRGEGGASRIRRTCYP